MYFHQTRYAIHLLTKCFEKENVDKLKVIQENIKRRKNFSIVELVGDSQKDKEMLKRVLSQRQISAVLNNVIEKKS